MSSFQIKTVMDVYNSRIRLMNINVLKEFLYTDLLVKQYITVKLECQFILIKFNNLALIVFIG